MAARQLARLRAKQEAAVQDASPEPDASEEDEITPVASRSSAPFNPFDLLDEDEVNSPTSHIHCDVPLLKYDTSCWLGMFPHHNVKPWTL
jgi:hypothetical protein